MKERWIVVMRHDCPLAKKKYVTAKDLPKLPLIMLRCLKVQSELASWFGDYYDSLSLKVSAIGVGCMGFSHRYGAAPECGEAVHMIQLAHEFGCNSFDTAEGCGAGHNEKLVRDEIKPIRNEIVLATKLHISA